MRGGQLPPSATLLRESAAARAALAPPGMAPRHGRNTCGRPNEEILLIIMTEDQRGLDDLEEIAAIDGVDIISLGPTDISTALGMTDPNDPRLRQTFRGPRGPNQRCWEGQGLHPCQPLLPPALAAGVDQHGRELHLRRSRPSHHSSEFPARFRCPYPRGNCQDHRGLGGRSGTTEPDR